MDSNAKRALNIFNELIEEGHGLKYGLEKRHINRDVTVKQKSETEFLISIERHPHVLDRSSVGKNSSAYTNVEQTFLLNTITRELKFVRDEIQDSNIDYYALAEEDFPIESGGVDLFLKKEDKTKLGKLISEKEVRSFAKTIFEGLDFNSTNKDLYNSEIELPTDFLEKMLEAQEEFFIDSLVENWKSEVYHNTDNSP